LDSDHSRRDGGAGAQNGAHSLGSIQDTSQVDLDIIARDTNVGTFDRIDVHGSFGVPCTYRGMIIPSG
jgi:hypothetical protein